LELVPDSFVMYTFKSNKVYVTVNKRVIELILVHAYLGTHLETKNTLKLVHFYGQLMPTQVQRSYKMELRYDA
jgi:hypothetical protein